MLKSIMLGSGLFAIWTLFATLSPFTIYAQSTDEPIVQVHELGSLPIPTGALAIGRVTVHWTDTARIEPLATDARNRELMVDIWYPAETTADPRAQYLHFGAFDQALGVNGLKDLLGHRVDELLRTGRIQTHAVDGAPFARSIERSPVLIFSHGMGP